MRVAWHGPAGPHELSSKAGGLSFSAAELSFCVTNREKAAIRAVTKAYGEAALRRAMTHFAVLRGTKWMGGGMIHVV